jgi:phosphomannomutase
MSNGVALRLFPEIRRTQISLYLHPLTNEERFEDKCRSDYEKKAGKISSGLRREGDELIASVYVEGGTVQKSIVSFDGGGDRIILAGRRLGELINGDVLSVLFVSFLNLILSVSKDSFLVGTVVTACSN